MVASLSDSTLVYRWLACGIALVVFKFIVGKALLIRTAFAKIRDCPGCMPLWINPLGPIGLMLGARFPRPGMVGYCAAKFSLYKKFGATSIASVRVSTAQQFFWVADTEAIKAVTSDRHTFQKDVVVYSLLNIYGGNLITLEGSDWKRHRSIAMSAFNDANVALVWSEGLRVINEWFERLDAVGPGITLDMLPVLTKATLFVITTASFGKRLSWATESTAELPGCKLSFQSAVMNSVHNVIFRALVPGWFYQLSSLVKVPYLSSRALITRLAFGDLRTHMLDLVASARAQVMSGERSGVLRAALLRNLVEANMNQDGDSKKLSEGELLSNIFAFLLAGHETSAHTLSFAFVLLALHTDRQQKLYEEVNRVWPADVPFTQLTTNHKEHIDKFEYTLACIRETLRMFPPAPRLWREVRKDTVLPGTYFTPGSNECSSVETGKFSMAVPAGSVVMVDTWGLHMNPLYWGEDVAEFKPERFIDTAAYQWPRHAYLPFFGGARSCIGQQFALAESIGILASVVRRYEIRVPDDLAKKSFKVQKEVLLEWKTGLTVTPVNARIKLCRRA